MDTTSVVCKRGILHTIKPAVYVSGGTPHYNPITVLKITKNSCNLHSSNLIFKPKQHLLAGRLTSKQWPH